MSSASEGLRLSDPLTRRFGGSASLHDLLRSSRSAFAGPTLIIHDVYIRFNIYKHVGRQTAARLIWCICTVHSFMHSFIDTFIHSHTHRVRYSVSFIAKLLPAHYVGPFSSIE